MSGDLTRLETFVASAAGILRDDARILSAWVGGSLSNDTADAYSDVDLSVAVLDGEFEAFIAGWRSLLDRLAPTVMMRRAGPHDAPILIAITPEWLRFDISIGHASATPRSGNRILFDRRGDATGEAPLIARPDPAARLPALVEEFLRVLGLLRVVVGRDEFTLAVQGAGILRWSLVEIFLIENRAQRGGMLHLNPFLTGEQRDTLESQPPIEPTRASALAVNSALAREFLPRARTLMIASGLPYPEDFERATIAYLGDLLDLHTAEKSSMPNNPNWPPSGAEAAPTPTDS